VEQKADVVCLQEPPRDRAGIGISHPAYEFRKSKRVWMAVREGSGLITNQRTNLNNIAGNDMIVVDI